MNMALKRTVFVASRIENLFFPPRFTAKTSNRDIKKANTLFVDILIPQRVTGQNSFLSHPFMCTPIC